MTKPHYLICWLCKDESRGIWPCVVIIKLEFLFHSKKKFITLLPFLWLSNSPLFLAGYYIKVLFSLIDWKIILCCMCSSKCATMLITDTSTFTQQFFLYQRCYHLTLSKIKVAQKETSQCWKNQQNSRVLHNETVRRYQFCLSCSHFVFVCTFW